MKVGELCLFANTKEACIPKNQAQSDCLNASTASSFNLVWCNGCDQSSAKLQGNLRRSCTDVWSDHLHVLLQVLEDPRSQDQNFFLRKGEAQLAGTVFGHLLKRWPWHHLWLAHNMLLNSAWYYKHTSLLQTSIGFLAVDSYSSGL